MADDSPNIAMAIGAGLQGFAGGAMEGSKIVQSIVNTKVMKEFRGAHAEYFKNWGEWRKKRSDVLGQMPPEAMKYYHQNAVWDHVNRQMDALSVEIQKAGQNADPALVNQYIKLKGLIPQLKKQLDTAYTGMIGKGVDPMHLNPLMEESDIPEPVPPRKPTADDLEEKSADQEDQQNYQSDFMDQEMTPSQEQETTQPPAGGSP